MTASELLNKLRLQKKFRQLKSYQKLMENATQLEGYLNGNFQPFSDNIDTLPTNGYIQVDKDLHYLFETEPSTNSTKVTELRSGDIRLTTTIEDNFFYQHMFNFALVVILLLQVVVVWAFIWCRLSKYGNQQLSQMNTDMEEDIALREIAQLPELIPQHNQEREGQEGGGVAGGDANRCGRYG